MSISQKKDFSKKHGPDARPDATIQAEIVKRVKNNEISCTVAFDISKETGISADRIGKTADLSGMRLAKCQLGLFGYKPKGKIVASEEEVDSMVKQAVLDALSDGKLSCRAAWNIASDLGTSKLRIGNACESMKIKIVSCQLGAF
ncbi:MAG: hypothetical protein A2V65_09395 [Deltaproteobacteria bacterium RBG_13_49_15]|nr:MAG: hypothetical protein A2V65_09395 [Deltaproteobacteria bacterium RBG_13_49_15]